MLDEHPALARQVVKDLAGRVMHLMRMVEDLSLRSVEARLARLLLELAEGEVIQRRRWATQAEMAARLGTVPDVVNRALRKLAAAGLIQRRTPADPDIGSGAPARGCPGGRVADARSVLETTATYAAPPIN